MLFVFRVSPSIRRGRNEENEEGNDRMKEGKKIIDRGREGMNRWRRKREKKRVGGRVGVRMKEGRKEGRRE